MTQRHTVTLEVNGADRTMEVEPRTTLLEALRERLYLTGTVGSCGEGSCGACTVLLNGEPVRACLVFAVQADRAALQTIEGLAGERALHPLQRAFCEARAVQCGYCTAGFLMLAAGALARDPFMDDDALVALVSANVCRCLPPEAFVRAIRAAQEEMQAAAE